MKRMFAVSLGILTAIGGMIDVGNLVANPQAGARFGMGLAWVIAFGVIGVMLYMEMGARIAVLSRRTIFDLVRERLGAQVAAADLIASLVLSFLTLTAEIGGVALILELVSGINYLAWMPILAVIVWLVIWRLPYRWMEKIYGLLGLCLLVLLVTVVKLQPDWSALWNQASRPSIPSSESLPTYAYFAIAQLGSVISVYQIFFFTSGVIEEGWTPSDLVVARANIFLGFPIGMVLALSLMILGTMVFLPRGIDPSSLSQVGLPTAFALGRWGLVVLLLGMFAAVFGASLEAALSCGYTVAQYFGWQWGKYVRPVDAARFHLAVFASIASAVALLATAWDPVKIVELVLVLTAASVPLTYLPVLIVANYPTYVGGKTNSWVTNLLGVFYLVVFVIASVAAVPLMIWTRLGA